MPKLEEIEEDVLVREVYSLAHAHAEKLVRLVVGGGSLELNMDGAPLTHSVRAVLRFAQAGKERRGIEQHMQAVAFASWGAPAHPTMSALGHQETKIGLVYVAAGARLAVLENRPVDKRGLNALTGVALSTINELSAKRAKKSPLVRLEPNWRDSAITAASARAWLASRGVPGFEASR